MLIKCSFICQHGIISFQHHQLIGMLLSVISFPRIHMLYIYFLYIVIVPVLYILRLVNHIAYFYLLKHYKKFDEIIAVAIFIMLLYFPHDLEIL